MLYRNSAKLQNRVIVRVPLVSIDLRCQRQEANGGDHMCRAVATMPDLADLLSAARQAAKPIRRIFPGHPAQARHARRFVARALDGCPTLETAVLLTSELVTNALTHTHTAEHGTFEVIIWPGKTNAYVAVLDDGSSTLPTPDLHDRAELAESGRGLELVELLSTRWGHYGHEGAGCSPKTRRTLVWFQLEWTQE